jgi:hypothetical protein
MYPGKERDTPIGGADSQLAIPAEMAEQIRSHEVVRDHLIVWGRVHQFLPLAESRSLLATGSGVIPRCFSPRVRVCVCVCACTRDHSRLVTKAYGAAQRCDLTPINDRTFRDLGKSSGRDRSLFLVIGISREKLTRLTRTTRRDATPRRSMHDSAMRNF